MIHPRKRQSESELYRLARSSVPSVPVWAGPAGERARCARLDPLGSEICESARSAEPDWSHSAPTRRAQVRSILKIPFPLSANPARVRSLHLSSQLPLLCLIQVGRPCLKGRGRGLKRRTWGVRCRRVVSIRTNQVTFLKINVLNFSNRLGPRVTVLELLISKYLVNIEIINYPSFFW